MGLAQDGATGYELAVLLSRPVESGRVVTRSQCKASVAPVIHRLFAAAE
jgi:hypothetical protein